MAPETCPTWSDGFDAHLAETLPLWGEIRPQLRQHSERAQQVDSALQKLAQLRKPAT
jgi:hypothetical protein